MALRRALLTVVRALGGFALARALTSSGLRILCYHGISLADEHDFQSKLFMRKQTFRSRLDFLRRHGYVVLALDHALALLDEGRLPPYAVVITFDDGWQGTGILAAPILAELRYPSTLYVTTRDVLDEVPVFSVTLRYLLWCGRRVGNLDPCGMVGLGDETLPLEEPAQRELAAQLIEKIAAERNAAGRTAVLRDLAGCLGVDWNVLERTRLFRLMSVEQLAGLPTLGMDLQLHTHCHRMPSEDRLDLEAEIAENRNALSGIAARPLVHFCYPSGVFHPRQFSCLRELGISSATTCLSGFNYRGKERLELRRFLDGENISEIEFAAELSGFLEIMRRARGVVRGCADTTA